MTVIYRMCNKENGKKRPFNWGKRVLSEMCLHSFSEAFRDAPPYMIFILDDCPEYEEFVPFVPFEKQIINVSSDNVGTFHTQLAIAKDLQGLVFFAEDDYVYRPQIGKRFVEAAKAYHFFTPYDHRGHYESPWVDIPQKISLINNYHYRTSVSTTLTFATNADYVRDNFDIMMSNGVNDHAIFTKLIEKGYTLGCPIPSFATHMEKDYLAPSVEWDTIWQKYL